MGHILQYLDALLVNKIKFTFHVYALIILQLDDFVKCSIYIIQREQIKFLHVMARLKQRRYKMLLS